MQNERRDREYHRRRNRSMENSMENHRHYSRHYYTRIRQPSYDSCMYYLYLYV